MGTHAGSWHGCCRGYSQPIGWYSTGIFMMAALWNRVGHYIFALWFLLSFFFLLLVFFSSPKLSGRRLDVYHTSTHMVWRECEFGMQVWNVLHAPRWKYRAQKWRKKSPSRHHRTTLLGCIFVTKACIDNRKKIVKQQYLIHICRHNMVNFGPLTAETGSGVWDTPANFNGFRVLAALLHGTN